MKLIALIGSGALAHSFANALSKRLPDDYFICGVFSRHPEHAQALGDEIGCRAFERIGDLLAIHPDIVIELASVEAVQSYAEPILRSGSSLVIASEGALIDKELRERLANAARNGRSKLYLPSGAIGGFDVMRTMALMGSTKASIISTKAPELYMDEPFMAGKTLDTAKECVVFEGTAEQAIHNFPNNVNVAVATSVVSNVPDTKVVLKSEPGLRQNKHEFHLENETMKVEFKVSAKPNPHNPKTSLSMTWSIIALLEDLASPIRYF